MHFSDNHNKKRTISSNIVFIINYIIVDEAGQIRNKYNMRYKCTTNVFHVVCSKRYLRKLSYTLTASFGDSTKRLKSTFSIKSDAVCQPTLYFVLHALPTAHGDIDFFDFIWTHHIGADCIGAPFEKMESRLSLYWKDWDLS